jgi:hypothetical protein
MKSKRQHIEGIYNRYMSNPDKTSLANAVKDAIVGTFSSVDNITAEFLQNADDSFKETKAEGGKIEFVLSRDHLLIVHNGRNFDEPDIESLCRYGESSAQRDIKKIGYKGIGFKSIFYISDEVYVFSGGYSFKFYKHDHEGAPIPWQIMPVWQENVPEGFVELLEPYEGKVVFLAKYNNTNWAEKFWGSKVAAGNSDREYLLFLKNISTLSFSWMAYDGHSDKRIITNENKIMLQKEIISNSLGIKEIKTSKSVHLQNRKTHEEASWIVQFFEIVFTEKEKKFLGSQTDSRNYPLKLRDSDFIELAIAAKVSSKNQSIIPIQHAKVIYTYLPTETQNDLPFLASTNFILNPERTRFIEEKFNNFLFEKIGYSQFVFIETVLKSDLPYKKSILTLFRIYQCQPKSDWEKATERIQSFMYGVELAKKGLSFVPILIEKNNGAPTEETSLPSISAENTGYWPKYLKKIEEVLIDNTKITSSGVIEIESAKTVVHEIKKHSKKFIADNSYSEIDRLTKLGAAEITHADFLKAIKETKLKQFLSPDNNFELVSYLYKNRSQNEFVGRLGETPFLLSLECSLRAPLDLFFNNQAENDLPAFISEDNDPFEYLHPGLIELIQKKSEDGGKRVIQWLRELGLRDPSTQSIVDKIILPKLDTWPTEGLLLLTAYLCKVRRELSQNQLDKLSSLRLLVKNQNNIYLESYKCYLSDAFVPNLPLEQYSVRNINFISEEYLNIDNYLKANDWRDFFIKLRVAQEMEFDFSYTGNQTEFIKKNYFNYWEYLVSQHGPNINFYDFSTITFWPNETHGYQYSILYWTSIFQDKRDRFEKLSAHSKVLVGGQKIKTMPYPYFLTRNSNCLPGSDNNLHRSSDLYSNSLKDLLNGTNWPIFIVPSDIVFEKKLGIITELSWHHYVELLESEKIGNSQRQSIYRKLLNYQFDSPQDQSKFNSTIKEIKLLSSNSSTKKIPSDLFFINDPIVNRMETYFLLKLDESLCEDAEKICQILGVNYFDKDKIKFSTSGISEPYDRLSNLFYNIYLALKAIIDSEVGEVCSSLLDPPSLTLKVDSIELFFNLPEKEPIIVEKCPSFFDKENKIFYCAGDFWRPDVRYKMKHTVAEMFGVTSRYELVGLMMELESWESISKWLKDEKNIAVYNDLTNSNKVIDEQPNIQTGNRILPKRNSRKYSVHEENPTGEGGHYATTNRPVIAEEDAIVLGKIGEEKYLNHLIKEYSLELNPEDSSYFGKNNRNEHVRVIWNNRTSESNMPFDFSVEIDGQEYFHEVKSTKSQNKNIIYLSRNEWDFLLENLSWHKLVRINLDNEENPSIAIYSLADLQHYQYYGGEIVEIKV